MEFNDYSCRVSTSSIIVAYDLDILSQSSGVNGSMFIVCATGGSRWMNNPTCKR